MYPCVAFAFSNIHYATKPCMKSKPLRPSDLSTSKGPWAPAGRFLNTPPFVVLVVPAVLVVLVVLVLLVEQVILVVLVALVVVL